MGRRTFACLTLSALAMLTSAAPRPQEMTLEQLVDRMEAAAAGLRGLRIRLEPSGGFVPPAILESDHEGNVRLIPWTASVVPIPSGREIILADGAWHFIDSQFYFAAADPGRRAEKLAPAACERLDPAFIPSSMRPQGAFAMETAYAPFLLLLSPRRMLAFERDLRLLGKRFFDGEECWVLRCEKDLGPPIGLQVKKFLVGVRDHRLRAATGYSFAVGQNTKWTARYEGAGLPSRVSLTGGLGWTWTAEWDLKSATREPGPARISPPGDLYATFARHPDLAERLKAAPEDPELLASAALRSGRAEDWEKVVAKRPALTPLVNLISRYAKEVAGDKLAALARRFEEDPKAPDAAVMEAARALNRLGDPDCALALLKRYGPEGADGVLEARSDAWALKGDAAKMVAEILPLFLRKEKPRTWTWSQVPPESAKIDAQELLHRLGEAIEAHPSCVALHLARINELARQERFAEFPEAARTFLALKPPADQVRAFAGVASHLLRSGPSGRDPQKLRPISTELLSLLEPGQSDPVVRSERAEILHGLGDVDPARQELAKLIETLRKADPADKAIAYYQMQRHAELRISPLYEEACALYLEWMKSVPPGRTMTGIRDPLDHPLCLVAKRCMDEGRPRDLIAAYKGFDPERQFGIGCPLAAAIRLKEADYGVLGREALAMAEKSDQGMADLLWAARLLEHTRRISSPRPHLPETRQLFAKAREFKPDSWPVLEGLIRVAIHDIDLAEAASLCREAMTRLQTSSAGASWTLPHLRTVLAYVLMESGDREGVARELESIDLARNEIEPWDAWKGSELWEALGRADRVLACLERLVEDGFHPGPRLAAVYEKAGRWEDALRAIDRAAPGNYDQTFLFRDPDQIFAVNARTAAAGPPPVDLGKLREGLLERGGDAMIRNFLARLRETMSSDEERRARAAFEKLGDDAIAERDKGGEELRQLGPKCAPVVKAGLESRDPELRRRSRALLLTWATSR